MSWIGTVVGGVCGFVIAGPFGAIIGASAGHQFSKKKANIALNSEEQARMQMAFINATFSVMGHVAKSDGYVTPEHIALANRIMDEMLIAGEMRKTCISLFQEGKNPGFLLEHVLSEFYEKCSKRKDLIYRFVEVQVQTAVAEGVLSQNEELLLRNICKQLGVSRFDYERINLSILAQQRFYRQSYYKKIYRPKDSLEDAYRELGLKPDASKIEVKKAYRRLMSQNHPDKLIAQGLPEEMMMQAKEKTQKISKAYERIQKSV